MLIKEIIVNIKMVLCKKCTYKPNLWSSEFGNVKFSETGNTYSKNKDCNNPPEPKTNCTYIYYSLKEKCGNKTDWGNALYCTGCSQASQLCEICGKDLKKEIYFDYKLK